MKIRFKSFLMFMLLACTAIPYASAYSFSAINEDGVTIYYNITSSKEPYTVEVYRDTSDDTEKYSGAVNIPSSVTYSGNTYSVTSIRTFAFDHCGVTSVTIPASVTTIDTQAFYLCDNLSAIYGPYASEDNRCCIINGVLRVFAPSGLTNYTLPNSVTSIAAGPFMNNRKLSSIVIPNSVVSIKKHAFYGCWGLTSMTIPESVESIESGAFYECLGLTGFYGKFASEDNRCLIKDDELIAFAPSGLNSYTIPNSVTAIGNEAFGYCNELETITLLEGVKSVGSEAFRKCSALSSVTIPASVTSIGSRAFYECSALKSVTIPASVTSIGDDAFAYCLKLASISLPESVKSIGSMAFGKCSALTSVILPASVTSIETSTFYGCSALTSVTIPASVTSIKQNAFYDCRALTSVTIPASVTSIRDKAFYNCTNLATVTNYSALDIVKGATTNGYVAYYAKEVISGSIPASAITLNKTSLSLKEGESETLISTVTPSNTTDVTSWKSSNADIATVDANGKVTAINKGIATISATCGSVSATCSVAVEYSQQITDFLNNNAEILNKTTATVKASDLDAINKALENFGKLSNTEQEKLSTEKKLLDSLKEKAEELKRVEAEINTFKTNNERVLGLTDETVKSSDIDAINLALKGYEALSENAKEALANEKKHLDELLAAAEAKKKAEEEEAAAQAEANKFKADYESVLSETVATVDLADKEAVNKAIEDYAKLSDRAKEIAKPIYDHIVELKQELDRLENEIAGFKENNAQVLSKTVEDVKSSDLDVINGALAEFDKLSSKAKTALANEKKHLDELLAAAEAKKKAEEEEAAAQAAANKFKTDYESVLSETVATVDLADKEAVNKAIEDYAKLSDRAKEIEKTDYEHLVELQKELNRLENEIVDFKKLNSLILSKTVEDVKSSDLDLINGVLAELDKLSSKAKTALTNEKKHLDELLVAAEEEKKAEEEEAAAQAEANKYRTDCQYILGESVETIDLHDKERVDKAIEDYWKLSDRAKEIVKSDYDRIVKFKQELDRIENEIAEFKENNSKILLKTVEDVKISDLDLINNALLDYNRLSNKAKAALADEKKHLDELQKEYNRLENEVAEFKKFNSLILSKTVEDVKSTDLDLINGVLSQFEKLSENAKEALANEKKHLEELLVAAEAKKKAEEEEARVQAEVTNFKIDNAYVLSRTAESVQSNDLDAINKALADYEKLSDKAKESLKETKTKLDELKKTAEEKKQAEEQEEAVQAEIANFKLDNAYILSRSVENVQSSDLAAIDKALSDFNKLSDAAKAVLANQKELLDSLKEKAEAIKKAEEEAAAVEKEVTDFCYENGEVLLKTTDDVTPDDLDDINKALEEYEKLSDKAKDELAEVKKHLDELKEEAEAQKQTAEEVKNFKDENKDILDKTVDDVTADDLDDINKALEDFDKLSDRAKDELTEVKKHLDELKEEVEAQKQTAEEVKNFKDENKDILDKTVDDVTADDLDDINKALEDFDKLSDRAKDELADEKKHLDELKDKAEGAGVDTIGADDDQNVKTYNLQGHEVSNNAKGILIQNGKKIYKK